MNALTKLNMPGCRRLIFLGLTAVFPSTAEVFEFNSDVLDIQDRENIDLTPFSQAGYIMPGEYLLDIRINGHSVVTEKIRFRPVGESTLPEARLDHDLVALFGLKPDYEKQLRWGMDGGLDYSSLQGMSATADMSSSVLNISVPQIYLEYVSANWDPPARWDAGVGGVMLDYHLNASTIRTPVSGEQHSFTGSGTLGANAGAWRFRADWQMLDWFSDQYAGSRRDVAISRYYAYRAIPALKARLSLGENYLTSDVFDSFRFVGAGLASDVSMLPPSLRGYAPEVNGVARSNATVVISQQGRILYQTEVPAGPFSIQDLNSAISGVLDVEIREEDGEVSRYQVATASLPYLTRPGAVRYKLTAGQPAGWDHHTEGPVFASSEASWGISNGWSLYGGTIGSNGYQSVAMGVGRDLFVLGALSADVTVSRQALPGKSGSQGRSLRINYAKVFEEFDSQVTFAGYRFSEESFYSMSEYLSALKDDRYFRGNSKQRFDLSFNKRFAGTGITAYLNYSHQSYWNRPDAERADLTVSHYFDVGSKKNISASVRAYRQSYQGRHDDGISLGISIPLGGQNWLRYDGTQFRERSSHSVGYSGRTAQSDSYSVRSTVSQQEKSFSGFWSRQGETGDISLSGSRSSSGRTSASAALSGGITSVSAGTALHGSGSNGGTRLVIDTEGVPDVPVQGAGRAAVTNSRGLAVVNGVGSFNRTTASIDLERMGDKIEALNSVSQLTLTEGAIGYRRMEVVAGSKGLAMVRLDDGKVPPFGALVYTAAGKNAGIVADDGQIWLSGMKAGETMQVRWDGQVQCEIALPEKMPGEEMTMLLLPCHKPAGGKA